MERPSRPRWLQGEARAEWNRQVKHLEQAGLIAQMDRAVLAAYCEAWAEFVDVVQQIRATGLLTSRGEEVMPNPLLKVRELAFQRLIRTADRFGFSPAARARVRVLEQPSSENSSKARFFRDSG